MTDAQPVEKKKPNLLRAWVIALAASVLLIGGLVYTKYLQVMAAIAYGRSFPEPAEAVIVATAESVNRAPVTSAIGELKAVDRVDLRIERAGVVTELNFKSGDTVFVSAASGAVGSIVCQLAKAHGSYVVGSAGSDEKCEWLLKEAKIDKAINYKKEKDLDKAVGAAFPKGIDGTCSMFDLPGIGRSHFESEPFELELYNGNPPAPGFFRSRLTGPPWQWTRGELADGSTWKDGVPTPL
jgi:hypothetical protein